MTRDAPIPPLDLIADAITVSDAAVKACPANTGRLKAEDKCPICGAFAFETCFRTAAADYRAMKMVREAYSRLSTQVQA